MNRFPSTKRVTICVENKKDFIESWNKIIQLKPSKILPGHGNPFGYKDLQKYSCFLEDINLYQLTV